MSSHSAYCDACKTSIRGIRFKCASCANFDLCENCFDRRASFHGSHAFHAIPNAGSMNNIRVEPGYGNPYKQQQQQQQYIAPVQVTTYSSQPIIGIQQPTYQPQMSMYPPVQQYSQPQVQMSYTQQPQVVQQKVFVTQAAPAPMPAYVPTVTTTYVTPKPQQQQPVQASTTWPIGVFYIRSKHTGLYLDAKGEGKTRGTHIIQWSHNKQKNQQWSFEAGGIIRCVHNGLCIDIKGASGNDIHLWEYENKTHQQWKWDGSHISSNMNGQLLDVQGASQKTGARICVWKPNGGKNQEWELIRA